MEDSGAQGIMQRSKSALYILIYILLSGGQIFFNKWVLSPEYFNFPYPITLTTCHMLFSTTLCFLVFHVFKLRKLAHHLTFDQFVTLILPIGAMFATTLWFGNTAFLYISISFAQMLKAGMPVVVLLISAGVGLEELTWRMLGIMSVISGGVLVASLGELRFSWAGVVYQLLGVVGESARLILAELLLKKRGLAMDPLSMMYYVGPASAACLLLPWYALEYPRLAQKVLEASAAASSLAGGGEGALPSHTFLGVLSAALGLASGGGGGRGGAGAWAGGIGGGWSPLGGLSILTLNTLCTFALNLSVFLVILHTSALTIRVAGVVKDWLVVLLSALLFADTRLTPTNILGYAVAITGVIMYNNTKLKPPPSPSSSSSSPSSSETQLQQLLPSPGGGGVLAASRTPLFKSAAPKGP